MGIEVRHGRPSDWEALSEAFRQAGRKAWSGIFPPEALAQIKPPERWREALTSPGFFVAEVEDEVAGFAFVRTSPIDQDDTAELDGFYTHPRFWGRGAGRALHDAALTYARSTGFTEIRLWTAKDNHRPRSFYEQSGWVLTGQEQEREIFGTRFVELRYRLKF